MMQISVEITDFLSFWIREREKWKGKTQLTRFMVLLFHLTLSVYYYDLAESSTFTALRGIYPPASFKTEPQKVSAIGEWGLGLWTDLGRDQSCSYSHMNVKEEWSVLWYLSVIVMDTAGIDPPGTGPRNTNAHTAEWKGSYSSWTHPLNPRSLVIHPAK